MSFHIYSLQVDINSDHIVINAAINTNMLCREAADGRRSTIPLIFLLYWFLWQHICLVMPQWYVSSIYIHIYKAPFQNNYYYYDYFQFELSACHPKTLENNCLNVAFPWTNHVYIMFILCFERFSVF